MKSKPYFYIRDSQPYPQAAVGFELWSMSEDIVFDNIIISNQQSTVDQWTADT